MANTMLAAALWYAKNGWFVFPCVPGAKVPLTERGFHDATTDEGAIRRWWADNPRANVAIATEASGLVVVDIDAKNDGLATYEALRSDLGSEPFDTLTALTPSGGQHLVYATDGSVVKSGAHVLGQGIDIRAVGGYIVAAPSEVGGKRYAWEVGYGPRDRKPAMWPDALAARIVAKAIAAPLDESGMIPSGERNSTLASIAGTLRRRGLDFDEICGALFVINAKRCNPSLPGPDVERIVKSICRYAPSEAIGIAREAESLQAFTDFQPQTALEVFVRIHNRLDDFGKAMPFGIKAVDTRLGGMYPQNMTILAARTGVGKSAMAEHIVSYAANAGRVLYFALELGDTRTVERIAARRAKTKVRKFREAGRPMSDVSWLEDLGLHFVGKAKRKITVPMIAERISQIKPDVVVIDQARNVSGWLPTDGKIRADLAATAVVEELYALAVEQNTHMLLVHQCNRQADGTRPSLADLRDAGAVEEFADNVIFLHRPFQFGDPDGGPDNVAEVLVWKSREGGTFRAHMKWDGDFMQYADYDPLHVGEAGVFTRCCAENGSTGRKRHAAR